MNTPIIGPISILIDISGHEEHVSFEKAFAERSDPYVPIFTDDGDSIGTPYVITCDSKTKQYRAMISMAPEEFIQKTGHNPEDFVLLPKFYEQHFKIGTQYDLRSFKLKLINDEDEMTTVDETTHPKCHCSPLKIYRRDLITKTGSEKVILAHFENGLITEMNRMAQQIGGGWSPDTWYNPTFSICKVEDVHDPSKYIARGLTGYRYTSHDTIEFNNADTRSYMRTTVDMNADDLGGKCAVFDSPDGKIDEHGVVCFDQFITCKDIYRFRFETEEDPIFSKIKGMIFGKLVYNTDYGFTNAKLGMLGMDRGGLTFIPADNKDSRVSCMTFGIKDILKDPDWMFEIRDCRFCELVPMELAYLKDEVT